MFAVLERACAFIAVIILGNVLKKIGIFKKEDFSVLSRIMLKITLPCAILYNFNSLELKPSLLVICGIGILTNAICLFTGFIIHPAKEAHKRPFDMINLAGFNVGTFTLPFAQSFLGPAGVAAASLYDTGNSIMCTGLNLSFAQLVKNASDSQAGISLKRVLNDLVHSLPFDSYILMTILSLCHLKLPSPILQFASIGANANPFISMLMIGIGMDLAIDPSKLGRVIRHLLIRYGITIVLALCMYHLPTFTLETRQSLCLMCLAPISAVAPAFTGRIEDDYELASTINSISILISITLLTTVLVLFFS